MLARVLHRCTATTPVFARIVVAKFSLANLSRMASTLPRFPIFDAISRHESRSTAVIHSVSGRTFTYGNLLHDVADAKEELRSAAGSMDLTGQRVAFLVENSYDYVGAQPLLSSREIKPTVCSDISGYFREQCYCFAPVPWLSSF